MDSNDDLTVAARVKGWEIFVPDWAYLSQHPAMQIRSLCGLSVGLHPAFADPSWVFNIAVPHFNGTDQDEYAPLEDAANSANLASRLGEFLRRVHIAVANLAPLGALTPAIGEADSVETLVRVADFATWADGMGWDLPVEFPRAQSGVVIGTRSNGNAVKVGGDGTAEDAPLNSGPVWWRKAREEGERWYAEKLKGKKKDDPPIEKGQLADHLDVWLYDKGYRNRSKHRISRSSILEKITGIVHREKVGMNWK